jgi:hypothetical protein
MFRLLKIMAFTYGLGVLMLVGWRTQTQEDGIVVGHVLFVASVDDQYHLYRLNLKNLKTEDIAPISSQYTDEPMLVTPDGKYVFSIVLSPQRTLAIQRVDLFSGQVKNFSVTNLQLQMILSPDGHWLYFKTASSLSRMRVDGTHLETLVTENVEQFRIMPDGNWVLYTVFDFEIGGSAYRMRLDGSEQELLFKFHAPETPLNIYFDGINITSSEYQTIFFTGSTQEENGADVWRMEIEGTSLENLTKSRDFNDNHIFSNQDWMLYHSSHGDSSRLYRMNLATHTTQILTPNDYVFNTIGVTSNKRWLIFISNAGISRVSLDTHVVENLLQIQEYFNVVLSPDDKWIFFGNFELYRMKLDGSQQQQLTFLNAYISFPTFVPLPPIPFHTKNLLALGLGIMTIAGVLNLLRNMVR